MPGAWTMTRASASANMYLWRPKPNGMTFAMTCHSTALVHMIEERTSMATLITRGAKLCLCGLIFLLAACGAGEESPFSRIDSPDGAWTLRITVAESRMPQGPFYITAYMAPKGDSVGTRLLHTKLENDGVPFTTHNIAARWVSTTSALLCLRATDLPDRGIRFDTAEGLTVTEIDQC